MDSPAFETLLEESAWLRRLARHMVANPSDADDVAQETWLAAGREGSRPTRSWMRVVARRIATKRRRAEQRRSDREWMAGEDEGNSLSGESLVERLELARRVARALQELPDPYRRTLYLRYYEGLEARVIAERENVPPGTVRWRAQRGRDLLRDALTRDGTTWESWACLLTPLAGLPAASTAGGALPWLGGIAMSLPWTLGGALAGALAAGAAWFARAPVAVGPETEPALSADGRTGAAPARNEDLQSAATAPSSRRTRALSAPSTPDATFGVIAYGQVTDGSGTPVLGARPVLEDQAAHLATGSSGPSGAWSLLGLAPGLHTLVLQVDGYLPYRAQVQVPSQARWRHDVVLQRGRRIPVRFEDLEGEALVARLSDSGMEKLLSVVATSEHPGPRLAGVRDRIPTRYGVGRFDSRAERATAPDLASRYQGVLHVNAAPPVWVSAVCRDVVLETRPLAGTEEELVFVVDGDTLNRIRGEVRLGLVDQHGRPVREGVRLVHPSGGIRTQGEFEGDQFVFRSVPPGRLSLRLERGSSQTEALNLAIEVPVGGLLDLGTIHLAPRASFTVRVADPGGAPLALPVWVTHTRGVTKSGDMGAGTVVRANDEGLAEISSMGPGPKLLRVGGSEGYARVALEADTSSGSAIEVVVPLGTEVVLSGPRRQGETRVLTGRQDPPLYVGPGTPRVIFLAPGSYTLTRNLGEREFESVPFQVGTERMVVRWSTR
jgi:RNA polymerase sigma factor (sigma-70 family)